MSNDDVELQIEILRIQVEQQHISALYSSMLSAEISVMLTVAIFYAGLFFYLGNPVFGWLAMLSLSFILPIALTIQLYRQQMKRFREELKQLRQRFEFSSFR